MCISQNAAREFLRTPGCDVKMQIPAASEPSWTEVSGGWSRDQSCFTVCTGDVYNDKGTRTSIHRNFSPHTCAQVNQFSKFPQNWFKNGMFRLPSWDTVQSLMFSSGSPIPPDTKPSSSSPICFTLLIFQRESSRAPVLGLLPLPLPNFTLPPSPPLLRVLEGWPPTLQAAPLHIFADGFRLAKR